ncbi:MAG: HAMP domain-containing sensor histidine kinase [Clostridia bacterium]
MRQTLKINLRVKLILFLYAVLLLNAVVTRHFFGAVFFKNTYEAELTQMTSEVGQQVQNCFEETGFLEAFLQKDVQQCRSLLFLREYARLEYADIWVVAGDTIMISYNEQKDVLEFDEIPSRYSTMLTRIFSGKSVGNQEFSDIWNRNMFGVGAPVVDVDGTVIAAIISQVSNDHVVRAISSANTAVSLSAAVALAFAAVCAVLISGYFSRPLLKMKLAAETWVTEDYSIRTDVKRSDEIGALATSMDVLAERLLQVQHTQEESERARYQFFADVSHELKTPVTVIRAQMEMLLDGIVKDPDEQRQYLQAAIDETRQMQRLVEDLLTLAKLQSPEFSLNSQPLYLCDILHDLQRSMQPIANEHGVVLLFSNRCIDKTDCMITGDYTRIRQMIGILIDNALKSSNMGNRIEINITKQERPVITVRDEGCGMDETEIAHVFERFYTHYDGGRTGSGLGLPLAMWIAKRHGAELTMESEKNIGTTVTIWF